MSWGYNKPLIICADYQLYILAKVGRNLNCTSICFLAKLPTLRISIGDIKLAKLGWVIMKVLLTVNERD